jgi:hypothetical protein
MAKSTLVHNEDDGALSVFASGDVLVFSCEHGHYWVVNAEMQSKQSVKPKLEGLLASVELDKMFERFA